MKKKIILFLLIAFLISIFFNQFNKYLIKASNEEVLVAWIDSGKMASSASPEELVKALSYLTKYREALSKMNKEKEELFLYVSELYEKYNKK